jgi:hypothetical protein
VQPGDNLFITIDVNGGADVQQVDFALGFDPNIVQAIDADPMAPGVQILAGSFPGSSSEGTVLQNAVNAGVIHYAYALSPGDVRSGSGTAATVQFVAVANGDAKLHWLARELIDNGGSAMTPPAATAQLFVGSDAPTAPATSVPTAAVPTSTTHTSTMSDDFARKSTETATATIVPVSTDTAAISALAATETPTSTMTSDAAGTSTATRTATRTPANSPTTTRTPAPTSTPRAKPPGGTSTPASLAHVSGTGQGDPSRIKSTSELPAAGASEIGTALWRWIFFLAALLFGIAGWFFTFAFHHGQKEVIIVDRFDRRRSRR